MSVRAHRSFWAALVTVTLSACGPSGQQTAAPVHTYPPPLKPGQVLDPESLYAKRWPGRSALFRLNEELGFAVPPGHQPFWYDGAIDIVYPPAKWAQIPVVDSLTFRFFMPDFRGYTPDNYLREFDEDRVDVISMRWVGLGQERPGEPGGYPPNQWARVLNGRDIAPTDQHLLTCISSTDADSPKPGEDQFCVGPPGDGRFPQVVIRVPTPPFPEWMVNPLMRARYFTPYHGGVEVVWTAHVKHVANWQIIDQQVWKFFEQWKIERPKDGHVASVARPVDAAEVARTRPEVLER